MRAILLSLLLTTAMTAEDPARAADHEALRGVLAELTVALSANAVADIVGHLDSEFSLTFVDQLVVRDRAGLDRAFATWFGPDSLITSVRFAPKADDLTVFTGQDAGWVAGRSDDVYTLKDGSVMTIPVRWTATVVRREGAWKVSTLHAGSNVIDNPVLDAIRDRAQRSVLLYALGALVVGLLAGFGVSRALRRR